MGKCRIVSLNFTVDVVFSAIHSPIPKLFKIVREGDELFLVMEFINSEDFHLTCKRANVLEAKIYLGNMLKALQTWT